MLQVPIIGLPLYFASAFSLSMDAQPDKPSAIIRNAALPIGPGLAFFALLQSFSHSSGSFQCYAQCSTEAIEY